jgi:flagellar protein FlaF
MFADAQIAYETTARATRSSRELEAAALFKAARMLDQCAQHWEDPDRPALLELALKYNQRLWTFFQAELSDPENALPVDLRSNLLSLSLFVDRRTFEMLANPDPAQLRALIDIDRHIATGLSTGAPAAPNGT